MWLALVVMVLVVCMLMVRCIVARVNCCSVTDECDSNFDRVLTLAAGVLSCVLPSDRIDEYELSYLESNKRPGYFRLLGEFPNRCTDKLGLCDAALHRIQTIFEFVTCQMRPFHLPDALIPEVVPRSTNLSHWTLDLQDFNSEFHHKTSSQNVVADWLSCQICFVAVM